MNSSAHQKQTLGARLAAARERQGIPIERAAKESRIRAQRLREIENDDFSQLSNASYARMFLIAYAKYLGVPREEIEDFLPEQGSPGAEDYQYIQGASTVLPTIRYQPKPPPNRRRRLAFTILMFVLLGLFVMGAAATAYLVVNVPRITSLDEEPVPAVISEPVDVTPVVPPGAETVALAAFQSTISITVVEMMVEPTPESVDLTIVADETPGADLPAETATDPNADLETARPDAFADDVEFLLGSSSEEPIEGNR